MTNSWDKFCLLFWKNWLLQRRHVIQTVFEILVPVIFSALMLLIRGLVDVENVQQPTTWDTYKLNVLPPRWIILREDSLMNQLGQLQLNVTDLMELYIRCAGDKKNLPFENVDKQGNIDMEFLKDYISTRSRNYASVGDMYQGPGYLFNVTKDCQDVCLSYLSWWRVGWAPKNNSDLEQIMLDAGQELIFCPVGFETEEEMEEHFIDYFNIGDIVLSIMDVYLGGVAFDQKLANHPEHLPHDMTVKLRFPGETRYSGGGFVILPTWMTKSYFPQFQMPGPRENESTEGGVPGYSREGFLGLQNVLSKHILKYHAENAVPVVHLPRYDIKLQRYPYPPYIDDPLLPGLKSLIPLITVLSFVYSCTSTVKTIISEKENQLKESMKMMGLPGWLHWTAWFTLLIILFLASTIFIVIILKAPFVSGTYKVLPATDWSCLFIFYLTYILSTITFCFLLTTLFSKANAGAILAGLLWFLCYFPFAFMQQNYEGFNFTQKMLACLLGNSGMGLGFQVILMYEGTGEGLQWYNIWSPASPDDTFTMGHAMIMLLVDTVIYMLLALYIEAVHPGEYGVSLPWYFPVTRNFWCGPPVVDSSHDTLDIKDKPSTQTQYFEDEPTGLRAGIKIKNLRKVYNKDKIAVNDLNLNMYEGQITVLLGHNGAGKTTTMSMLTGLYTPTSGTALLDDHDIRTDMDGVRETLGLCPQHNVLFNELTVREHLYFFGKLKGLSKKQIKEETTRFVKQLELVDKLNSPAGTLSGGMQRKLAVAVALCGGSKVVLLDEPTSGMDPSARRCLWDLLQCEKINRTILLTTHFMDEADLLGDRIAIMSAGQLKCCGSSFFLKKKFGGGYRLIMVKGPDCKPDSVTDYLKEFIPDLEISSNIGSELSYLLDDIYTNKFETMFEGIEDNYQQLQIISYGVSSSTIEDVFITAGGEEQLEHEPDAAHKPSNQVVTLGRFYSNEGYSEAVENDDLIKGWRLLKNQIVAMFIKYFLSTIRSYILYLFIILIPILDLTITILVMRSYDMTIDQPPRDLNLKSFPEGISLVGITNHSLSDTTDVRNKYREIMTQEQTLEDLGNITDEHDVWDYTLEKAAENVPLVLQRYTVGALFKDFYTTRLDILGWFNNQPYHGPPIAVSYIYNALYKTYICENASINIVSAPLPFTVQTKLKVEQSGATMGAQLAFNMGFSMSFVAAFIVILLVDERVTKSKLLQFVSGVNIYIYWFTAYIWNIATLMIPFLASLITIVAFQERGFDTAGAFGRMFLLLFCYSFAITPMVFLSSFMFSAPATGFVRMALLNMITGVLLFIITIVLETPSLDLVSTANILDWVFTILPSYSLSYAFYQLNKNYMMLDTCEQYPGLSDFICHPGCRVPNCLNYTDSYYDFQHPGIGRNIAFFFVDAVVLTFVLILLEARVWEMVVYGTNCGQRKYQQPVKVVDEDSDVATERYKIESIESRGRSSYNLLLENVTKYYGKFLAVNNLCLGVHKGECFGLLGVNGAGKTSLFKMLTGDEKITFGDGFVDGFSLKYNMKDVYQRIGYCPQFDALIGKLTGRETLKIFCLLRGVKPEDINYVSEKLAKELLFLQHIDKKVKEYSGGNKRKLSTAVALVGDPPVIYLDEPTTGMDPVAKRHLWNVICNLRNVGKTIILTSHSMEECEALCTRLAIMVNGEFKCLGSTQHLKNKFAQGYTLTVKTRSSVGQDVNNRQQVMDNDLEAVREYVFAHFQGAQETESYQGLLTYYIPDPLLSWSKMFGLMEAGKKQLNIEDYCLGQTSLEQVFLSFTRFQLNERLNNC